MPDRREVRQRPRPFGPAQGPSEDEDGPGDTAPARQGERTDGQYGLGSVTDPVVQGLPHVRRIPAAPQRDGDDDGGEQGGRAVPAEEHGRGAPLSPPALRPGQEAADAEAEGDQGAHEAHRGDVREGSVEEQHAAEERGERMILQVVLIGAEVSQYGGRPLGGQPVTDPGVSGQEQADVGEGQRRTARVLPHGAQRSARKTPRRRRVHIVAFSRSRRGRGPPGR